MLGLDCRFWLGQLRRLGDWGRLHGLTYHACPTERRLEFGRILYSLDQLILWERLQDSEEVLDLGGDDLEGDRHALKVVRDHMISVM